VITATFALFPTIALGRVCI